MQEFKKAEKLLRRFKGDKYHFGQDILGEALKDASKMGRKAILFRGSFPGSDAYVDMIVGSLKQSGTILTGVFKGARPNSPKERFAPRRAFPFLLPLWCFLYLTFFGISMAKSPLSQPFAT